jgi:diacylglycerol kinase
MTAPKRSLSRRAAFAHAFSGWWYAMRSQANARFHTLATVGVIVLGIWLRIDRSGWVGLILAIGVVWVTELANTALEAAIDLAMPQEHPMAQIGKDVAAAMVLTAALCAAVIGALILLPALLTRVTSG